MSLRGTLRRLFARIRRILGFGVMHASAPLRNWSGEPIRARAWLESCSDRGTVSVQPGDLTKRRQCVRWGNQPG